LLDFLGVSRFFLRPLLLPHGRFRGVPGGLFAHPILLGLVAVGQQLDEFGKGLLGRGGVVSRRRVRLGRFQFPLGDPHLDG